MGSAVIVDVARTASGKRNGALSGWHPADLAGSLLKTLVERNDLDPSLVEDVIMGCVTQMGAQAFNVGRSAVLAAGLPETTCATTVDRQCGSSQQAAHFAAQGVMAGAYDVVIAAGVEVMSRVPMGASGGLDFSSFGVVGLDGVRRFGGPAVRSTVRPWGPRAVSAPGWTRVPRDLCRDGRRSMGSVSRRPRPIRREQSIEGGPGDRRGAIRIRDRPRQRQGARPGDGAGERERRDAPVRPRHPAGDDRGGVEPRSGRCSRPTGR